MGPGEAKGELWERLTRQGLQARIVGVEAADKMTDRQIAALVRERFAEEPAQRFPSVRALWVPTVRLVGSC